MCWRMLFSSWSKFVNKCPYTNKSYDLGDLKTQTHQLVIIISAQPDLIGNDERILHQKLTN